MNLQEVTVAILAGGLGTRLRPVVPDCPKPLAKVHERPYLTYLFDQLVEAAVREVVLLTGYRAEHVYQTLGDNCRGLSLVHSPEPFPLGTGGGLRLALPRLTSSFVLVMNGDSYCEVDLAEFWDFHGRKFADVSLVLTEVADSSRYGGVTVTAGGRLLRFGEKEPVAGRGWINAGIYLIRRSLIEEMPSNRRLSLERDLIPEWIGRGLHVYGLRCAGRFIDIGTPSSYAAAEAFFGSL